MPSNVQRTQTTRAAILQAAAELIQHHGSQHLTLLKVARQAGISKGALTHHYPSKDLLLNDLIQHHLTAFSTTLAKSDLPYGVAYVRHGNHDGTRGLAHGLIAALGAHPAVMETIREHASNWQQHFHTVDSTIARLATDGLWLAEVLGLPVPEGQAREQLLARLEELASDPPETTGETP